MAQTLNFNGIQAESVTFNGVVVSNVYFNGQLVFSGADYKMEFTKLNVDYLNITKTVNVDSQFADFTFEFEVDLANVTNQSYLYQNMTSSSIRSFFTNGGGLRINKGGYVGDVNISGMRDAYKNSGKIIISIQAKTTGLEVYFDGNLEYSSGEFMSYIFTDINIGQQSSGTDIIFYNMTLVTEFFELNEGSGFGISGDEGSTGLGATSNAGGLTYWNSNVWQLV